MCVEILVTLQLHSRGGALSPDTIVFSIVASLHCKSTVKCLECIAPVKRLAAKIVSCNMLSGTLNSTQLSTLIDVMCRTSSGGLVVCSKQIESQVSVEEAVRRR